MQDKKGKVISVVVGGVFSTLLALGIIYWPDAGFQEAVQAQCAPCVCEIPEECAFVVCEGACGPSGALVECLWNHGKAVCAYEGGVYKLVEVPKPGAEERDAKNTE